jgi:zinc protease
MKSKHSLPEFTLDNVTRTQLDNGLTIVTRLDRSIPVVTSMLWYRVGSRYEATGKRGMSHFLEHMMFKGTQRYPKGMVDYLTARHGGANNAFTSNDYTAYYFSFAADRWQFALDIEADRMTNAVFEPEELELERQVIIEELKMELDNPWGALRQAVELNSFEQHPYRYPVIGFYEDLLSISRDEMVDYYRRYYSPANAILVIVGDFQPEQAMQFIDKLFAAIPSQTMPPVQSSREAFRQKQVRVRVEKPANVPRMLLSFPAPSVRDPENHAMQILDKVLSEGKMARLYQRLIDKERIASVATAEYGETFDPYVMTIRLQLFRKVEPAKAEEMVFEELRRLGSEPISDQELERSKNQCRADFLNDFETTLDQAAQLGLLETIHKFEYWQDYQEQIERVTTEQVMAVAGRYLSPDAATVGILTNGKAD